MPAYIIVEVEITDPKVYEEYKKLVPPTIAAYGGKYLARGGATETLEGKWMPKRLVILEFESMDRAKKWLESPEYSTARGLRHQCAKTSMVLVEGMTGAV